MTATAATGMGSPNWGAWRIARSYVTNVCRSAIPHGSTAYQHDFAADPRDVPSVTSLSVDGETYEIERVPLPSWDDYEVFHDGRRIGRVRVLVIADENRRRKYTIDGGATVESVARAAIHAGIIVVRR